MTLGSLFAGIGGIDLGFERAGFTTKWQVEINPYCRSILERHFPNAKRFEDIRRCSSFNLGAVDVIAGGFPCQDISNAGQRAGIGGERSSLWNGMARIIRQLQPSFVLVENVSALLVRGLDRALGDLAAIGYDAEWHCIPASHFGAPHQRDRVWVIAYPARLFGSPILRQQPNGTLSGHWEDGWREYAASLHGMDDGVPGRVDGLTALGNAVVPQIPEYIAKQIAVQLGRR